jgi:hypothetical protein
MFDFSIISLKKIAECAPNALILFPDDILEKGLTSIRSDAQKASIIGELFVRLYLSLDVKYTRLIEQFLTHGEVKSFMDLVPKDELTPGVLKHDFWQPQTGFSQRCLAEVRRRMQLLSSVDGFIPVYLTDGSETACFLPFSFQEGKPGAFDEAGKMIPEWSDVLTELGIGRGLCVHCRMMEGLPFEGRSLMLPIQVAFWRKQEALPKFNIRRLLSTGEFDRDGKLRPVSTSEKVQTFAERFHKGVFVFPESSRVIPSARNLLMLPAGLSNEEVLERIRPEAERFARFDLDYAIERIPEMWDAVHDRNYKHWDELIQRLENAAIPLDRDENPWEYLLNLMLQATANCHAGRTSVAEEKNAVARKFAAAKGDEYVELLLRLEIGQLINLQDREDFIQVAELAPKLVKRLEALAIDDLLMRYHGTMGQAHAYGYLSGIDCFSETESLVHFETAKDCAFKIGKQEDKCQDLNYLHLWHALFKPNTTDEHEAYDRARKQIDRLKEHNEKAFWKNLYYLKRTQAFAWYRFYLKKGDCPSCEIDDEFNRLLRDAEDWIRATVGKYLGTLEAAKGNFEYAQSLFSDALGAIKENSSNIKTFIKMTVAAQAAASLNNQKYFEEARKLLETSPDFKHFASFNKWQKYLFGLEEHNPAIAYWY